MKIFLFVTSLFLVLPSFAAAETIKHATCELSSSKVGGSAFTEVQTAELMEKLEDNGFIFTSSGSVYENGIVLEAIVDIHDEPVKLKPDYSVTISAINEDAQNQLVKRVYKYFFSNYFVSNRSLFNQAKIFFSAHLPKCEKI